MKKLTTLLATAALAFGIFGITGTAIAGNGVAIIQCESDNDSGSDPEVARTSISRIKPSRCDNGDDCAECLNALMKDELCRMQSSSQVPGATALLLDSGSPEVNLVQYFLSRCNRN